MWEYGINKCKELAYQYECETYDYIQLSEILVSKLFFLIVFIRIKIIVIKLVTQVSYRKF